MELPLKPADLLIYKEKGQLEYFAVIACDQHTQSKEYWQKLEKFRSGKKSALDLMLPEYLLTGDDGDKVNKIVKNMYAYLDDGVFDEISGMVLVSRSVSGGGVRTGLVLGIDLECYDYELGSKPLIRASEGTVKERIPPRVQIRKDCPIELPHIMLLYDDKDGLVDKAIRETGAVPLYDFELNMGGGHITGRHIADTAKICAAFGELMNKALGEKGDGILFAVGDGNHSLAAAKAVYESEKAALKKSDSPKKPLLSRYALCEAVNIYDSGVVFLPIHRLIKGRDAGAFIDFLRSECQKAGEKSAAILSEYRLPSGGTISMPDNCIDAVRIFEETAAAFGGDIEIDYIHGDSELNEIAEKSGGTGLFFKETAKDGFFDYIAKHGAFPKKTFSIGEARDKRYYLEARRIK